MSQSVSISRLQLISLSLLSTGSLILTTFLPALCPISSARAVEFPDGRVAFDRPPRLIRTASTSTRKRRSVVTYHFTVEVPEDAGEPLKVIEIEQLERSLKTIVFQPEETRAFLGNSFKGGPALSLATDETRVEPGKVTVVFDPPVPPGSTITIAIDPKRNPSRGGTYLFQVTAFPAGEIRLGQSLGYGRLRIYN